MSKEIHSDAEIHPVEVIDDMCKFFDTELNYLQFKCSTFTKRSKHFFNFCEILNIRHKKANNEYFFSGTDT